MQSNALKSRGILKKGNILLLVFGVILTLIDANDYSTISNIVGVLWIVISILCSCVDKFWWKVEFVQKLFKLPPLQFLYTPVIEGHWSGTLTRDKESHPFTIEINQTLTSISCRTFSKHSYSDSECAELLYDEQHNKYKLVFLWRGKTENTFEGEHGSSDYFYGTTILDINESQHQLSGEYFTNRSSRQTKGRIVMTSWQ